MTEPQSADDRAPATALPRHTTPTWEVELLISGVAVFAMLQLSGWLDAQLFVLGPRFDAQWASPMEMMYIYFKSATLILAITFGSHLLLRALWIAAVGMHSVYPDGIRWDRLRMGPLRREAERAQYGSADASVERADNRATIVFAVGVTLATGLLQVALLIAAAFCAVYAMLHLAGLQPDIGDVFVACAMATTLPFLIFGIDRRFGARLREGGRAQRALRSALRICLRLGLGGRGTNPTFALLSSHRGERWVLVGTTLMTGVVIVCVLAGIEAQRDPTRIGSYGRFPRFGDGARTLEAAHYDDQRDPARDPALPYIRSAVAIGPYLPLVVPYRPADDATAARCDTAALRGDALAARRLDCLQRAHPVLLDGKPLAALRYDLSSDARTDRPALVAMIDIRALSQGRHELRIGGAATRDGDREGPVGDREPDDARIAFWR